MYIRTWHDGFHLFPEEMLFNIAKDPHEQSNVAPSHPEPCHRADAMLKEWHEKMMKTMPQGYTEDPMDIVLSEGGPFHARGHLSEYCKRLQETCNRCSGYPPIALIDWNQYK